MIALIIMGSAVPLAIPAIAAPTARVVDDFIIPTPIADPQTPDEEFFNYRLQFFLPETEPLIKATFGEQLRFEDEAFWEYESYYSRAVSFATNLPTLAKIEYGQDETYGFETKQTESYFYQHLFYLTGLQPGHTYHYRIKVMDSDGTFMASPDYTFTTPAIPADIIRIPDDLANKTLPYKLTTPNAKYLLTEDIYAPFGGILLSAHNIELDLGGHTISYDNEPNPITWDDGRPNYVHFVEDGAASYGVKGGTWNLTNQRLYNGTIIQGKNGSCGEFGSGLSPVIFYHGSKNTVAGITADYYGDNMSGIVTDAETTIHHNVVYDRGSVIDNRHQGMKAISSPGPGVSETYYNSVRRSRHFGIATGGIKYGNEVYSDSFGPNSYLMTFPSNSNCYNNKLFGMGYNPIGIGWYSMSNAVAANNFIYLHAYAPTIRDPEYQRISGVAGYRPQVYDSNTPSNNNLFENNVVICKAWPGAAYIRALWIPSDICMENTQINNNIIVAETMTNDINVSDMYNCFTCVDLQGEYATVDVPQVLFSDNLFRTNVNYLVAGTSYGIGNNASFYRNTFMRINHHDDQFWPFRLGFWDWSTTGHKFIDSIEGSGVDLSVPPNWASYYTEPLYTLSVGISSERVYVDASTGLPLSDKIVHWQLDGGSTGSFNTNSKGMAYVEWITTWNEHKPGDRHGVFTQVHNSTISLFIDGYQPMTVNIADTQGNGPNIQFVRLQDPLNPPTANIIAEDFRGRANVAYNDIAWWSRSDWDYAEVYRANALDGVFSLFATTTASPFFDNEALPENTYYYKIRLVRGSDFGPVTDIVKLTTLPIIAEDFRGRANPGNIEVAWWSRSVWDHTEVYRADTPDGVFSFHGTTVGSPYFDYKVLPGQTYYYKIRLVQGNHMGQFTNAIGFTAR